MKVPRVDDCRVHLAESHDRVPHDGQQPVHHQPYDDRARAQSEEGDGDEDPEEGKRRDGQERPGDGEGHVATLRPIRGQSEAHADDRRDRNGDDDHERMRDAQLEEVLPGELEVGQEAGEPALLLSQPFEPDTSAGTTGRCGGC